MTCTTPASVRDSSSSDAGDVVLGEPLDGALRLTVARRDEDDAHALGDPPLDVRRARPWCRRDRPAAASMSTAGLLSSSRPNGETVNQACPRPRRLQADVVERVERRRAEVDRRLATRGRGGPRRLQELLARGDEVGSAGADPLGIAQQDRVTPAGNRSTSSSISSTSTGASDSMPSTAWPSASL